MRWIWGLGLVLLLAGCASVPLSSIPDLRKIDFLATDLEAFRVALRLPQAVRPKPGGVVMDAVVKTADRESKTSFLLVPDDAPRSTAGLAAPSPGTATHIYRLAPADIARFQTLRSHVEEEKRAGRRGAVGLGIETKEFCSSGPPPAGKVSLTTYLLAAEVGRYVPVVADLDLRRDKALADLLTKLSPC